MNCLRWCSSSVRKILENIDCRDLSYRGGTSSSTVNDELVVHKAAYDHIRINLVLQDQINDPEKRTHHVGRCPRID